MPSSFETEGRTSSRPGLIWQERNTSAKIVKTELEKIHREMTEEVSCFFIIERLNGLLLDF